jgi:hypothetical protein
MGIANASIAPDDFVQIQHPGSDYLPGYRLEPVQEQE